MKNEKTGFTLIELLVVISIIAILAAILFPVLSKAKARGRTAHCVSNMNQIGKALKEYALDNNNYMPPTGYFYGWNSADERPDPRAWTGRIWNYTTGERRLFICPEMSLERTPSYGICWRATSSTDYSGADPFQGHTDYTSSGNFILMYECSPANKGALDYGDWDLSNDYQQDGAVYDSSTPALAPFYLRFPGPHNKGNNILFGDGHVKLYYKWEPEHMTFNPVIAD